MSSIGGTLRSLVQNKTDIYKQWIKEAKEIRKKGGTTENRDEGQYFLPHIFDDILMKQHPIGSSTGNSVNNRQKIISLITVMTKATADCQNVHSK